MFAKASIRAFFRVHPRTFRDGIRLYAAYALSVLLQIFVPSRFGSVGRCVPGRSNLGVSVDRVHFDVRPRTNDLDLISGKYEPLTAEWFQVGIGDVVVDAGAHIGLYTLRAATKAATVVAVEPDPSNRSLLERNIRLNGFSNIIVVPKALSSLRDANAVAGGEGEHRRFEPGPTCVRLTTDHRIRRRRPRR